ncbi:MAG: hypothetical protein V8Q84_04675 [Bilophila sp.]
MTRRAAAKSRRSRRWDYCSNCKNCDIACPSGVKISTLNMLARADWCRSTSRPCATGCRPRPGAGQAGAPFSQLDGPPRVHQRPQPPPARQVRRRPPRSHACFRETEFLEVMEAHNAGALPHRAAQAHEKGGLLSRLLRERLRPANGPGPRVSAGKGGL